MAEEGKKKVAPCDGVRLRAALKAFKAKEPELELSAFDAFLRKRESRENASARHERLGYLEAYLELRFLLHYYTCYAKKSFFDENNEVATFIQNILGNLYQEPKKWLFDHDTQDRFLALLQEEDDNLRKIGAFENVKDMDDVKTMALMQFYQRRLLKEIRALFNEIRKSKKDIPADYDKFYRALGLQPFVETWELEPVAVLII